LTESVVSFSCVCVKVTLAVMWLYGARKRSPRTLPEHLAALINPFCISTGKWHAGSELSKHSWMLQEQPGASQTFEQLLLYSCCSGTERREGILQLSFSQSRYKQTF